MQRKDKCNLHYIVLGSLLISFAFQQSFAQETQNSTELKEELKQRSSENSSDSTVKNPVADASSSSFLTPGQDSPEEKAIQELLDKLRELDKNAWEAKGKRDDAKATELWNQVFDGLEQLPDSARTAFTLRRFLTQFRGNTRKYESKLEKIQRRIVRIYGEQISPETPELIGPLLDIAKYERERKQLASSEQTLLRALSIAEKNFGNTDYKIAPVLEDYCRVLSAVGKKTKAEEVLERLLRIYESSMEANTLSASAVRRKLADVMIAQGKAADAEGPLRLTIESYKKSMGPDSLLVASNMDNLAELLFRQNRLNESAEYFDHALKIKQKIVGNNSQFLLNTLEGYAKVLQQINKNDKRVKEYIDQAQRIRTQLRLIYSPDDLDNKK